MNFCKKLNIWLFVLILCFVCSGCGHVDQKSFFKRDSAYDQFVKDSATQGSNKDSSSAPRRVGNIIYLGSSSSSSSVTVPGEPSFAFEDLKR